MEVAGAFKLQRADTHHRAPRLVEREIIDGRQGVLDRLYMSIWAHFEQRTKYKEYYHQNIVMNKNKMKERLGYSCER